MRFLTRNLMVAAAAALAMASVTMAKANTILPVEFAQVGGFGPANNIVNAGGGFYDWYYHVNLDGGSTGSFVKTGNNLVIFDFDHVMLPTDVTIFNQTHTGFVATLSPSGPFVDPFVTAPDDPTKNNIVFTYLGVPDIHDTSNPEHLFDFKVRIKENHAINGFFISTDQKGAAPGGTQSVKGNVIVAVPEASTMLGFGGLIGMGGLAFLRRSRKK